MTCFKVFNAQNIVSLKIKSVRNDEVFTKRNDQQKKTSLMNPFLKMVLMKLALQMQPALKTALKPVLALKMIPVKTVTAFLAEVTAKNL